MNNNQIEMHVTKSQNHDVVTHGIFNSDIKQILDRNSEQFWNDVKMKFLSREKQDRLNMFEDVYSKYQNCQFYIWLTLPVNLNLIKEYISIFLKSTSIITIDHIKEFDENAWNNWREILDTNSQRFWNDIKGKFISAEFENAIKIIENIMGM